MSLNSVLKIADQTVLRRASRTDAFAIVDLYRRVYEGTYSDPVMGDPQLLQAALKQSEYFWFVGEQSGALVASVVYRYDPENALAKVYGAVVEPSCRGQGLTEKLMIFGYETLRKQTPPVEVVYATTRTVSSAPQKLTANLGYKKLGVFPNVHKTDGYETHCLTAKFTEAALQMRFTDFELHPKVAPIFEITRKECGLAPLPIASRKSVSWVKSVLSQDPAGCELEVIQAEKFVKYRFNQEKAGGLGHHWFFPFHEPNLLLTTADQSIEVFCFFSLLDQHCVLIGVRDANHLGLLRILEQSSRMLRDLGARYVEFIMRADEIEKIESSIQAEFIPGAYFPSMHQSGEWRFDFVSFSRSFEILNFKNLSLEGVNRDYILQYFNLWKDISLPSLDSD